jgi:hypothetical protein
MPPEENGRNNSDHTGHDERSSAELLIAGHHDRECAKRGPDQTPYSSAYPFENSDEIHDSERQ